MALPLGVGLVLVAGAIFLLNRGDDDSAQEPEGKAPPSGKVFGGERPASGDPTPPAYEGGSGGREVESSEEIDRFLSDYARVQDLAGKMDLLTDVRSLDPPDHPAVIRLLLGEMFDGEEAVRATARDALAEYGDATAIRELEIMLNARPDVPERQEVEQVLDFLRMPRLEWDSG